MSNLPIAVLTHRVSEEIAAQGADFRGRVICWAIEAAIAGGFDRESALALLADIPPERHWWHIRQVISEQALQSLYSKIVAEFGLTPKKNVYAEASFSLISTPTPAPDVSSVINPSLTTAEAEEWEELLV